MRLSILGRAAAACLALAALAAPSLALAAAGLTADIVAGIANGSYAGAPLGGATPAYPLALSSLVRLTPGTAAGNADRLIVKSITIAASGTQTLNLTTSLDPFGVAAACLHVKAIYVAAATANTNDVLVAPGATNPFTGPFAGTTPSMAVRPGGVLLNALGGTGWSVTASTGDTMLFTNSSSGTSVTFTVAIACTST